VQSENAKVERRPTGPGMTMQRWIYCPSCWATYVKTAEPTPTPTPTLEVGLRRVS
jgi:hypothetical protein